MFCKGNLVDLESDDVSILPGLHGSSVKDANGDWIFIPFGGSVEMAGGITYTTSTNGLVLTQSMESHFTFPVPTQAISVPVGSIDLSFDGAGVVA